MLFKERLRELRTTSPYTQKDIAQKLNISVSAYQYYEAGKNEPNIEKLIILADMFGISIDYLVGHSVQMKDNAKSFD
ncbi:MAG: helix-turn-helix transcriptional regulator [Lachnospiraceae bacterium]|nr:helix-turn-helix transcriptional regulator [Lachnospiraceae bacterium]